MSEFLPQMNFQMFTGQVEDTDDPLKLGRVRVRAHGYHTQDTTQIPTEDLPWAHVTYNDSTRAFTPSLDEWVVGFFMDGREAQKPIILGVLPGLTEEEPTTSRWFRNERTDETDIDSVKKDTESVGRVTEPDSPYDAEYPNNKVIETSSGHLIEIDDTPGAERLHIYHKSGTFHEYHPDGKMVSKTAGDAFEIHLQNKSTIVKKDNTTEIEGDKLENVGGDIETDAGGNKTENISGKIDIDAGGVITIDGQQIELNGKLFSLTMWQQLNAALQLWVTQNNILGDTHLHLGNLGYPVLPAPSAGVVFSSNTIDISGSEASSLKTNG